MGYYYRMIIPEAVRKLLKLDRGDEIVWIQEGGKVVVERAGKTYPEGV